MELILKDKKLANPNGNRWEEETEIQISEDGLNATIDADKWHNVVAEKEFCLSVEHCREDNFPGLIFYYFEVTQMSSKPSG
jgi:hypothetical protein